MSDTEEEDLALYGEPVTDDTNPSDSASVPVNKPDVNEQPTLSENKATPADEKDQLTAKAEDTVVSNGAPVTENNSEPNSSGTKENAEGNGDASRTPVNSSGENSQVGKESIVESGGPTGEGNPKPADEKVKNNSDVGNEKAEKEETGDKESESTDEDDDDGDDDDDDDDDDDSEDDDFDVVLNYDDNDAQPKPPNASFGSIGKVRLSSNKWQRPGYVPPERVIGAPTQGAARAGGVLAMLPTPTMQIGGSQKSVYDLEIGKLTEKPWLDRNADLSDYFNYGFNEETWKLYCERQKQMRLEASMLAKIKTVDGSKPQAPTGGRAAAPGSPKQMQAPVGVRVNPSGATANRGNQNKPPQQGNQPMPPPPPGMMQPPIGFEGRPGGMLPIPPGMEKVSNMPNMPNMPKIPGMPPNMPFPFAPGAPNQKGGNFQPPFPPFFPMPGGQRNGDGKKGNMFPMMPPGMPGMPPGMPMPPGGMPPGVGPEGGGVARGFPGEMQTPQKIQHPQKKDGKSSGPPNQPHRDDQKRANPQGHQGSRFGNAQNGQSRGQSNRPGHHDGDNRQRWNDNRSHGDRRQGYDRQGGDHDRGRGGHDDRGYGDRGDRGDRGYDRRRWSEREEGYDRRRGGGRDSQRYGDSRRDYDRDRDREYRKRSMSGRDYDDDRKRSRR